MGSAIPNSDPAPRLPLVLALHITVPRPLPPPASGWQAVTCSRRQRAHHLEDGREKGGALQLLSISGCPTNHAQLLHIASDTMCHDIVLAWPLAIDLYFSNIIYTLYRQRKTSMKSPFHLGKSESIFPKGIQDSPRTHEQTSNNLLLE